MLKSGWKTTAKTTFKEIQAERCRRSFFYFLKTFWHVVIPEDPVYNWHIPYLCNELQRMGHRIANREPKEYDLIINIPPGSTKSTIATVMFPVWLWTIDPRIRALTASYAATLSVDHAVRSRDIIRSDKFVQLFPEITLRKDSDNKSHYKNIASGERLATSVTGKITGFHGHVLIVDDPLNPKEALSDVERLRACEFMSTTLSTRKIDKAITPTILIMQRLHVGDPTGDILERNPDSVKHICLPAEKDANISPPELAEKYTDGLLDPVRMNRETLAELAKTLGSYGYAGQFQQRPAPADGAIWERWLIPIDEKDIPPLDLLGTDWDLAYTEKDTNSASAFVTAGRHNKKMYITDAGFKWLEFPKLISYMSGRDAPHYIEAKASGKSAKQTLKNRGIPAKEVQVTGGDKEGRTRLATPYAESGLIYVRKELLPIFYDNPKQSILLFPNTGDDLNDALVQAINRLLGKKRTVIF